MEVGTTIPGTLPIWRLEAFDERCNNTEDAIDSVSALFESRICWNFESCATVRLVADSPLGAKLLSVLPFSSAFKKSEILSLSVVKDPEFD